MSVYDPYSDEGQVGLDSIKSPSWYNPPEDKMTGECEEKPQVNTCNIVTSAMSNSGYSHQSNWVPTQITTNGSGSWSFPPNTITGQQAQIAWPTGGLTTGTYDWEKHFRDQANKSQLQSAMPSGNNFIILRDDYLVRAHGAERPLIEWLGECKHVRYIRAATEIVILRAVWDSLFIFMRNDGPYADLELPEFLDKIHGPKATCTEEKDG